MPKLNLSKPIKYLKVFLLVLSVLLWLITALVYWRRPDVAAALTLWPAWVWLGIGLVLCALAWRKSWWRISALVVLLWLVYLVVFVEEPHSLLRFRKWPSDEWLAARGQARAIRVISLNCAGEEDAFREVAAYAPDIVCLQESPRRDKIDEIAREIFGYDVGVLTSPDCSIIVRGTLLQERTPQDMHLVRARVLLSAGMDIQVISTHLYSVPYNFALWEGNAWLAQANRRQDHREQMARIVAQIDEVPQTTPIILAGDFNSPSGDAIFRLLGPRLRDAFEEAGLGWPNTIFNDKPLARIDQVWVDDHFSVSALLAKKTQYSDHRMVICDLIMRDTTSTANKTDSRQPTSN